MALIKYNPGLRDFENKSFSNFIDRFFNESLSNVDKQVQRFSPQVDIAESDTDFEVTLAVPGMKKSDFKIDLNDDQLIISGERKFENTKKDKNFHSVETHYGSFSKSFYLPDNIKKEKIEAGYEDGLLTIRIPKDEKKETIKTISIK